jgi:hypothetical protein
VDVIWIYNVFEWLTIFKQSKKYVSTVLYIFLIWFSYAGTQKKSYGDLPALMVEEDIFPGTGAWDDAFHTQIYIIVMLDLIFVL